MPWVIWICVLFPIALRGTGIATSQEASPPVIHQIGLDLQQGRFLEAVAKADQLVALDPNNALAHTYLGMAWLHLNLPDRAIAAFERSIAINPGDPRPHLNLALLYASRNDLDRAIRSYQTGLALDPQNSTALFNYGKLLMRQGRFAEAAGALDRMLRLNPHDIEARMVLVDAHLNGGQRLQAHEEIGWILESKQTPVSMLPGLAASLIRAHELALARTVLNAALSLSPNLVQAHLELSRLYAAYGQHDEAVRSARRGVELSPGLLEAHLALAEAFIGGKRYLEALDSLSKVETHFQNSAAYHYTRGVAEMGLHRRPPAIAAFEKAIELDPTYDPAQFLLGTAYYTTGDMERAEAKYKAAIALNSKNALYLSHLAGLYDRRGPEFEHAARKATLEALALNPDDPECNQRLARWALAREDLSEARTILERVVARNPQLISPRVLLAQVYSRLKLRKEVQAQQRIIQSLEEQAQKRSGPDTAASRQGERK